MGEGVPCPGELTGLQFQNQRKSRGWGRETSLSFFSRRSCLSFLLPTSAPSPGCRRDFSRPYRVKLGPQIIVLHVCREHVLGISNFLSSLGSLWVSRHHCVIVLGSGPMLLLPGFIAKPACLVLWLSKPAPLSNH